MRTDTTTQLRTGHQRIRPVHPNRLPVHLNRPGRCGIADTPDAAKRRTWIRVPQRNRWPDAMDVSDTLGGSLVSSGADGGFAVVVAFDVVLIGVLIAVGLVT